MSNSLDTGQDRHFVCPDLGPNCSQSLSVDDKIYCKQGKSLEIVLIYILTCWSTIILLVATFAVH